MEDWMDGRMEPRGEPNKIRRGPGRRIAKEKRFRQMDSAVLQKYMALPPALQEKVNAAIEICYQQHMSTVYKNMRSGQAPGRPQTPADHHDRDVDFDPEQGDF